MPHKDKNYDFIQRLSQVLAPGPTEFPYRRNYESVKRVAKSIEDWLAAPTTVKPTAMKTLQVQIEPGFQGSLGQQLNVVLDIPDRHVRDTLFRVYLQPSGEINLDLYGEETVPCTDEGEMQEKILEFLGEPENKSRLNMYKDLLTQ
jgi:hypothetical protein